MLKNNLSKQFIFEFIFKFFSANQLRGAFWLGFAGAVEV